MDLGVQLYSSSSAQGTSAKSAATVPLASFLFSKTLSAH